MRTLPLPCPFQAEQGSGVDTTSSFRGTLVTLEPHHSADRLRDARCFHSEWWGRARETSTRILELDRVGAWLPQTRPPPPTLHPKGERPDVTLNGAFSRRHPWGQAGASSECATRAQPHSWRRGFVSESITVLPCTLRQEAPQRNF